MPRTKLKNGVRVPLSPDEERDRDADEAAWIVSGARRRREKRSRERFMDELLTIESLPQARREAVLTEAVKRLLGVWEDE